MESKHLIVFTCNWHAYHALELTGAASLAYDTRVLPVRLTCLGRISAGIVLKAFEQGALGVLLLGCPSGSCQYDSGFTHAEEVVTQTRKFMDLLGYSQERLRLENLTAETAQSFADAVDEFLQDLDNAELTPKNDMAIPAPS